MARIKETTDEEHDIALELIVGSLGRRAQETIVDRGDSDIVVASEPKRGWIGSFKNLT
jgi:hypothetical protein